MQILLPTEHFEHTANLQLIKHGEDVELHAEPRATSAEENKLTLTEFLTLSEEVKEANQTDGLCIQICAYSKPPSK